jgi:predicted secreted hydrolase
MTPRPSSRRPPQPRAAPPRPAALLVIGILALVAWVGIACTAGPLLANAPAPRPAPTAVPPATPAPPTDPQPVALPRDDGPHTRLTEWWYYTGHLRAADGRRFGFEDVIFRAERGNLPVSWASHVAITDETGHRFHYAQRMEIGPQVDRSPRGPDGVATGFDLSISGIDPRTPRTFVNPPWTMSGSDGADALALMLSPMEAAAAGSAGAMALRLTLAAMKPPALHDGDGFVDFGPAGGSYYYSRTRMAATGSLVLDGVTYDVDGSAWFDHQWGDFVSLGSGGGWDWYAIMLEDGTEVVLNRVRAPDGSYPVEYGEVVGPDGATRHLSGDAFSIETTGSWTSPATRTTWPAGWTVSIPGERLEITLEPTVADQELDTRATTGVIYWEGSQVVTATRDGRPIGGEAYVELTGYATDPGAPSPAPPAAPGATAAP